MKKESTNLDKIKKRYDMTEKSAPVAIFGDRNEFMKNIKYEGSYKGYDMYSFVDKDYMTEIRTCCPALNVHNYDQGIFNGDLKAQLEDLKVGMDSVIKSVKKGNGKLYSFVLGKTITV